MKHTFTGMVTEFPNRGIHFVIAEALKFISTKLQRTAKWLEFDKRTSSPQPEAAETSEEKEARVLESGGVDKRTVHDLEDEGE